MAGVALVTGGAQRLGAIIARRLADDGWRVAIHYGTSRDAAAALAAELPGGVAIGADLADDSAAYGVIDRVRAEVAAPVAALVNSASLFEYDTPPLTDAAALRRHMAVNVAAPVMLASAMAEQDDLETGAIVNLLDQKLANPNPDFFSYSLSKFALSGATTLLAQKLAPRIRVNAVAPGITLPSGGQSEAEFARTARGNLLRRAVDPAGVADAVAWLLRASNVTGQTIYVDNGQRFVASARDVMFEDRG